MEVKWYYEEDDEDMLEAGEDYEAIIDLPFEMIEVERNLMLTYLVNFKAVTHDSLFFYEKLHYFC